MPWLFCFFSAHFPMSPKALNGLILEYVQEIPEVGVGVRIHGIPMEKGQTENRRVKVIKIYRSAEGDD